MNLFTSILVFVIVWWLVLFTVLPWGAGAGHDAEMGREPGAPERPRLWLKVGVTTLVAMVVWTVIYFVVEAELITLGPG